MTKDDPMSQYILAHLEGYWKEKYKFKESDKHAILVNINEGNSSYFSYMQINYKLSKLHLKVLMQNLYL